MYSEHSHSSTRSHTSEEENRTRNRSENGKCKAIFAAILVAIFSFGECEGVDYLMMLL